MASADQLTKYSLLCHLLVDIGHKCLRDTFDGIYPPPKLRGVLAKRKPQILNLRRKNIISPLQWKLLYPKGSSVSSESFDLTLLVVLLRNICGLHPPTTGWNSLPPPADTSIEANIARVKFYRNSVLAHAYPASVDGAMFSRYWQDISSTLVALGGASYEAVINDLKNKYIDPGRKENYREQLKQWKKEEDSNKDELEKTEGFAQLKNLWKILKRGGKKVLKKLWKRKKDIEDKPGEVQDQGRDDFQQMMDDMQDITDILNAQVSSKEAKDEGDFGPAEIIDGIRQLYKLREGWLAPFPWCEEFHFHLDDIFTRLKVVSWKKTRLGTTTTDTVDMSGIFKPHDDEECPLPRTVLIEGKPGMGKTTYCQKLVYDWATGKQPAEDSFPRFDLVLLLRCRDIIVSDMKSADLWEAIDDQLLPRDVKEDVRERFFDFIRQNQSKVLLILDGLDEVPANKLSMFSEIIQGRVLPKCRLVATARHEAGIRVRIHCDTLLEIEGFTEEDAREFIIKFFKTMGDLAQKLLSKLRNDYKIKEMTANPLNTALLCLFCEEFEGVFPESRTKLYLEIVQCVLKRYILKKGLSENNEDLMEAYKPQLKHLGQIALKGLREGNLDFDESELGSHSVDLPGFGFLSVQPGGSKLRPRRRYGFLHKSFQEWFAAYYLCCQLLDNEISADSLAADRNYLHELLEVLKFTCGLLAARCEETATTLIKSITTQVNHEDNAERSPVVLECIGECKKDESNFDLTLARVSGSILKVETLRLPLDRTAVSEVVLLAEILKVNSSLTKLDLSVNSIGDAGATGLAESLRENASLTKLNLSYNGISKAASALAESLKENASLTVLNLAHNYICDAGAGALAEALRENASLTELNLSHNLFIGDSGAAALAKVLRENSSLRELYLSFNDIGVAAAAALAEALRVNASLTELDLSYNSIDDAGAAALAETLRKNSSLKVLDLSGDHIYDPGAKGLAEALRENASLTKLNLSDNSIDDAGAAALAKASLKELHLSQNSIGYAGAAALAKALGENTSLTKLNLSLNGIDDAGAASLAKAVRDNSSLTELDLSVNNIGFAGAASLAESLRDNSSLTKLNLGFNSIGDTGATRLAEALRENLCLETLYMSENDISEEVINELRPEFGSRVQFDY